MSNLSNSPNQKTLQLHIHAEHRGSLQQSFSHLGYSLRCHMTFIRTSQTSAVKRKKNDDRSGSVDAIVIHRCFGLRWEQTEMAALTEPRRASRKLEKMWGSC